MLQTFFDRLPDHQADLTKGSSYPTQVEQEGDDYVRALRICMADTCANPTIMYSFMSAITDVPSIDLTTETPTVNYPQMHGNIAGDNEDNIITSTVVLSYSSNHQN